MQGSPFGDPGGAQPAGYERPCAKRTRPRSGWHRRGGERAQTRQAHGMVHIPDEETLRRMDADHAHEGGGHGGVPDYASHDTEMKLPWWATPTAERPPCSTPHRLQPVRAPAA